ncbi:MAG: class I SAM-dependent methyltransferase [Patescibacteria group bacterium]|jgi:2-polyprenyl-3-methyl-5-hydroxy-6-metoxy-1,4-benzoquinol methylase|nr:class I SAM-dependent methyltransferase [Patescibacteria group bacterium]
MGQISVWENEYKGESKLVTKHDKPQATFLRFLKYYKKQIDKNFSSFKIFDAGCGTGRNSNHLASMGFRVSATDISNTAIKIAKERAKNENLEIEYFVSDLGKKIKFEANTFDLVIDVTSSNSLDEKGRDVFLSEVKRCLKPGGYFFVRGLCLDGDKNAKYLLKNNPGPEKNTYKMPVLGLVERVFTRDDFENTYSKYFKIEKLIKESGYTRFSGQNYKRNFWIAYLRKL